MPLSRPRTTTRALGAALVLAALAPVASAQGSVLYVDADAAPGGDGASWASAFRDLQAALAVAEAGDEVWIAEGTYKPTTGNDRTATFTLQSGVALYGGFDGTEVSRDERDWAAHVSTLSGDIGAHGDSTDNAYHVVTANAVDATAVLDGLTVERGRANAASAPNDRGSGLLAISGSPTIRNARLRWNRIGLPVGGEKLGGGMYVEGGSPLVEDTVFDDNAANSGSALYASGSAPVLRRVAFRRNGGRTLMFADRSAGVVEDAVFEENRGSAVKVERSSPMFRRSTFRDNVLPLNGAGAIGAGAHIDGGAPLFEDCLFERLRTNTDLSGPAGAVYVAALAAQARPAFVRTTFRENTANAGGAVYVSGAEARFFFCHFEHNRALGGGAVYGSASALTVVGSTFVGNRAEPGQSAGPGGAIRLSGAPLTGGRTLVASTLFAGNQARDGGAVAPGGLGAAAVDLVNVTLAGNRASEEGGGVHVLTSQGVRLHNAVLWGNEAPLGPEAYLVSGSALAVERAVIAGGCPVGATCSGVLDEDPLFVRAPDAGADGEWGTADDDYGDLRVQAGSPAIDGGLASLLPPDVWDLDGDGNTTEPLPLDVAGGARVRGSSVDVGAYERGGLRRGDTPAEAFAVGEAVGLSVAPNPFRDEAAVSLTIPEDGEATVGVYDVLGRRVALLHAGPLEAGAHTLRLDGSALPAGVYVVRVEAETAVLARRVTVVR